MSARIQLICDQCVDDGREDVDAHAVPVMIGATLGVLDVCKKHVEPLNQLAHLVEQHGRPVDEQVQAMMLNMLGIRTGGSPTQETVECGLCATEIALNSRAAHAKHVHQMSVCDLQFLGNQLLFPSPAEGCEYASPSPQGMTAHVRARHPKLVNTG